MAEDLSLEGLAVLIIGYARGNQIIEIINKSISAGVQRIYVHLDGPKDADVERVQGEVIEEIVTFSKVASITVLQQDRNLGVALGVISAIKWFFSQETKGYIIEDDLVVSEDSFSFVHQALDYIQEDNRTLMVAASSFQKNSKESLTSANWTNFPLIWGWGTTRDKWRILFSLYQLKINWWESLTASPVNNFFLNGSLCALSRKVDTWDSPLAYQMLKADYLCLVSPKNLVMNIGVDKHAVHTKSSVFPLNNPLEELDVRNLRMKNFDPKSLNEFNSRIMKEVFGIKWRHWFSPFRNLPLFLSQDKFVTDLRDLIND
jgi:hypothetical protein